MDDKDFQTTFWKDTHPKTTRRYRRKKSRPGLHIFLLLAALFISFGFLGYQLADSWLSDGMSIVEDETPPAVVENESKQLTLLLMGVDDGQGGPARADTIILAFIDMGTHEVKLLSIPRDTYLDVPGNGTTKVNHAHAYGGPDLMTRTVSNFLGIPVRKYLEVDFDGFRNLVDILGGVQMDVEKNMRYRPEGINLAAGDQLLDGDKALQYVRFRDGEGDIGRINRQQKFLKTFAEQSVRLGTVLKLPNLMKEIRDSTITNLTLREMLGLAKIAKDIKTSEIEAVMVPGDPIKIKGISYWQPDREQTHALVDKFLARDDIDDI